MTTSVERLEALAEMRRAELRFERAISEVGPVGWVTGMAIAAAGPLTAGAIMWQATGSLLWSAVAATWAIVAGGTWAVRANLKAKNKLVAQMRLSESTDGAK